MVKKSTKKPTIVLGHLYPKEMNVYGDMGNIITLRYRLEARGFGVTYRPVETLKELETLDVDILVGGGGQDSNQELIQADIIKHAPVLKALCNDGLVCLMICGMYQMFGHRFVLPSGEEIPGAGVIDIETRGGSSRLIGNIVVESAFGNLVGFENHSGRTYLGPGVTPLGKVVRGFGNNSEDGWEGVLERNIFGSYMHGPLLAKNPQFADELLTRSLLRRGYGASLKELDDTLELTAASVAIKRPQ